MRVVAIDPKECGINKEQEFAMEAGCGTYTTEQVLMKSAKP